MILPSNGCALTQPNNEANSFFIDWESEISLKGKWEVALTEFSFINFYEVRDYCALTYSTTTRKSIPIVFYKDQNNLTINGDDDKEYHSEDVTIRVDKSGHILIDCVDFPFDLEFNDENEAKVMGFDKKEIRSTVVEIRSDRPINLKKLHYLHFNITTDSVIHLHHLKEFTSYKLFPRPDDAETYIKNHCYEIFDQFKINANGKVELILDPNITSINFDKNLSRYFGFEQLKLINSKGKKHTSSNKLLLAKPFHQVFIYSNIVEPVHVGGVRVPLLRLVWVENKYDEGALIHENIDGPMYLPVCGNSINNIEVELRDYSGRLINFTKGSITTLTLHFRKK